ncbi:hypothetical protein V7968_32640 [Nocardia vulneris]|uniref:hypothetical protein n=1 Tax=Nocardia vulneris TaxID=1141657 RepID=UPI0030D08DF1
MALIVGIHGMAQQYRSGYELVEEWLPALRGGLAAADHKDLADSVNDSNVRVCFFGELFRPRAALGAGFPPFDPSDLSSDIELGLLAELYNGAVERQPELGPPGRALGPLRANAKVMIDRLLQSRTFAGLAERAFIGNLKQVTQFLGDSATKEKVLARAHDEIDDTTKVIIGHSLGSVVAYEYLCRYQPSTVELLITAGSPLGIPNVIFHRLTPTPTDAGGAWPGVVTRWVNVADANDVVALRAQLAGLFPPPPGMEAIVDEPVVNGRRPHAIRRYLNAEQTGAALASMLARS